MNDSVKTLLGSIGENHRNIRTLLKEKNKKMNEVQSAMDQKARTKTPLDERQQAVFYEMTGILAQEGGNLQQSLIGMEHTIHNELHIDNTELFIISLVTLHSHQNSAIHSLRRMIASSENTLKML